MVRTVDFPVPKEGEIKSPGHNIVIQCAENIDDRITLLNAFGIVLVVSVLFIMILSASGGFFIAKKAMKPIRDISGTIDRISETNLSERIDEAHIPDELKNIASSFNRAFGSLERAFGRQRQFVSDASHELKTPLAVIIAHGEIARQKGQGSQGLQNRHRRHDGSGEDDVADHREAS